jgi:two-component system, NarL family, nitrate/nitrite response regulator NarL
MLGEQPIKVLVADGQPIYLDGVARVIRQDAGFQVVAETGDGKRALAEIARLAPDVALVDATIGPLRGERIVIAVRRERIPTRIVLLAASPESASVYRALAEGAAGCLTKQVSAEQLRRALVTAARGEVVIGDGLPTGLAAEIRLREDGDRPVLSDRERAVLRLLADGQRSPEIGRALHLAPTTVKGHLSRIYEKLEVGDRAAAVAVAMRRGLLE